MNSPILINSIAKILTDIFDVLICPVCYTDFIASLSQMDPLDLESLCECTLRIEKRFERKEDYPTFLEAAFYTVLMLSINMTHESHLDSVPERYKVYAIEVNNYFYGEAWRSRMTARIE